MKIVYECGKIMGTKRYQSDELFVKDNVFAVADGMGDKNAGKLASKIAIQLLEENLYNLEKAFITINKEIINRLSKHADGLICGTTLSVVKLDFESSRYNVYHAGDSKVFLIRDKSLIPLTVDQNKIENGKKYVKALGINWHVDIYKQEGEILQNDVFFISTDGICDIIDLFDELPDKTPKGIKDFIVSHKDKLIDNLSFIVLKVF
jgi:serine/threonine protein phosphatase PrpC